MGKERELSAMVSVIIPTFNRPHLLRELIGSIEKHVRSSDFEIIIVDDNSTQENMKKASEEVQKAKISGLKIEYVYSPEKHNPAYCRTIGAETAKGRILYFIDDDCQFFQDNILLIDVFYSKKANENSCLAGPLTSPDDKFAEMYNRRLNFYANMFSNREGYSFFYKLFSWAKIRQFKVPFAASANFACPRHIYEKVQFDSGHDICEDWVFCKEVVRNYTIVFMNGFTIRHNHRFVDFNALLKRLHDFDHYDIERTRLHRFLVNMIFPVLICIFYKDFSLFGYYLKIYSVYNPIKHQAD